MTEDDWEVFKQEILNYCRQNLAKIDAYIPSPFVSKYVLDQVAFNQIFLLIRNHFRSPLPSLSYPTWEV